MARSRGRRGEFNLNENVGIQESLR
jgi:hypothetical protein